MTSPFNPGDLVKSYHFQPMSDRPDRYVIGRVTETKDGCVHFDVCCDCVEYHQVERVEYNTPDDRPLPAGSLGFDKKWVFHPDMGVIPETMFTPLPGNLMTEWAGRVSVIEEG